MQAAGYTLIKTTDYETLVNDKEYFRQRLRNAMALAEEAQAANQTFASEEAKLQRIKNSIEIILLLVLLVSFIIIFRKFIL